MRVIFLDIDGVIVPDYQKVNDQAFSKLNNWSVEPFSIGAINILNKVLLKTKAKVVISSDWRLNLPYQELKDIFDEAGIVGGSDVIIGYTPIVKEYDSYQQKRYLEIQEWVNLHKPEYWVAIDDLNLSEYLYVDNFVHCKKPNEGLKQCGKQNEIEFKLGCVC